MSNWKRTKFPSVYVRHQQACPAHADEGARCRCRPSYYAQARSKATGRIVKSKVVHDINEAQGWLVDFRRGAVADGAKTPTFRELADQFLDAADHGLIRPKRGKQWSPLTLYTYRLNLDKYVLEDYGNARADRLTAADWQGLIDKLHRKGLATNSISTVLMPVRSVYRYACSPTRRLLSVNATYGLEMPAPDEKARDRIAAPEEAATLLGTLKAPHRVAYALAFYAGLRRREVLPCTWDWIDFERGIIDVQESKTEAGIRIVPMAGPLRAILLEERMRQGNPEAGQPVVLGPRGGRCSASHLREHANEAFKDAGLEPIGLHECRHTYASFMIAAGVNAKAICTYMGHASIQITFDRYGHLMPGNEAEAAEMLDSYLKRKSG